MITPRSALKFDLFAEASRQHKRDEVGDPLQVIARHIDFAELARLVDALIERGGGRRGGRPAYPTEVMVRILVLKRLYNLSDEQMEYQLLDRGSYQRFCLLQDAMNVPDRNTIWRFGERLGVGGATALFQGWMPNCSATATSPGAGRPLMPRWCPRPDSTSASRSGERWHKAGSRTGAKRDAGKRMWRPRTRRSTAKATSATSSA